MRRGRILILIALLLVLSAAAIFAVFVLGGGLNALLGRGNATQVSQGGGETAVPVVTATSEPVLHIIAAAQNLERGVVIPTEALQSIPWPTTIVPPSAITDPNQVVGTRQGDAHSIWVNPRTGGYVGAADRRLSGKVSGY